MAYTAKDLRPPHIHVVVALPVWRLGKGGGENVHLLTHAPARGVGKTCIIRAINKKLFPNTPTTPTTTTFHQHLPVHLREL